MTETNSTEELIDKLRTAIDFALRNGIRKGSEDGQEYITQIDKLLEEYGHPEQNETCMICATRDLPNGCSLCNFGRRRKPGDRSEVEMSEGITKAQIRYKYTGIAPEPNHAKDFQTWMEQWLAGELSDKQLRKIVTERGFRVEFERSLQEKACLIVDTSDGPGVVYSIRRRKPYFLGRVGFQRKPGMLGSQL